MSDELVVPQDRATPSREPIVEPELPTNVAVPERVLWQEVEGEVVLLDLGSDTYHALNDVGSRMWKALDVTGDVDAAYERLREVYDVDDAVLRQDMARFISGLLGSGLLSTP